MISFLFAALEHPRGERKGEERDLVLCVGDQGAAGGQIWSASQRGWGARKGRRREESREEGEAYLDGVNPSEMRWRWSTRWRTIAAGRSGDGGRASAGFHARPEEAEISLPVDVPPAGRGGNAVGRRSAAAAAVEAP
jgi:hypothetical protein